MSESDSTPAVTEVVGVFFDAKAMQAAANGLAAAGVAEDRISLLTSSDTVKERLDELFEASQEREGDFEPRAGDDDAAHGFSRGLVFAGHGAAAGGLVVTAAALGGPILTALAAAAAVGSVGATVESVISQSDTQYLQEELNKGHILLFAGVDDAEQEARAKEILGHESLDLRVIELKADNS